jgi:hypothetical protein
MAETIYPDRESAMKAGAVKFWGKPCVKHPDTPKYTRKRPMRPMLY